MTYRAKVLQVVCLLEISMSRFFDEETAEMVSHEIMLECALVMENFLSGLHILLFYQLNFNQACMHTHNNYGG